MLKNASVNCSDYVRVLNIPQYTYNNIIIIIATNAIMLVFFFDLFMHPVTLLSFYLFKHQLEHKNNES